MSIDRDVAGTATRKATRKRTQGRPQGLAKSRSHGGNRQARRLQGRAGSSAHGGNRPARRFQGRAGSAAHGGNRQKGRRKQIDSHVYGGVAAEPLLGISSRCRARPDSESAVCIPSRCNRSYQSATEPSSAWNQRPTSGSASQRTLGDPLLVEFHAKPRLLSADPHSRLSPQTALSDSRRPARADRQTPESESSACRRPSAGRRPY